jgi:hypothetical protein
VAEGENLGRKNKGYPIFFSHTPCQLKLDDAARIYLGIIAKKKILLSMILQFVSAALLAKDLGRWCNFFWQFRFLSTCSG